MVGGVRKRGKTWSYYHDLASTNGVRKKKEKGGFRTKKEAETALAKEVARYTITNDIFTPSEISVADYLALWFDEYVKFNLKYTTQQSYKVVISNHLIPTFGDYKLKAITPALVQAYINNLKLQGLAKHTIVGILTVFSGAYNYAVEPLHYVLYNPCDRVKIPKFEAKPNTYRYVITPDVFARIIERFPDDSPFHIPLMLGYHCGFRASETFGLTWRDIDFDNRTITINKQLLKRNREVILDNEPNLRINRSNWYFGTTKTSTSNRTVKMTNAIYTALLHEKKRQQKNKLKLGSEYIEYYIAEEYDEKHNILKRLITEPSTPNKADMLCLRDDGSLLTTDSLKYCSRVIHHDLGIKEFNYHSLRHTHATYLVESGAPIKAVQKRLGHTNIRTTLDTYVHNTDDMDLLSVELFEKSINKKAESF